MFGYIYKTTVCLEGSVLYGCYYIGQRKRSTTKDCYYGSGKIIKDFMRKHGTTHLKKEILAICESKEELDLKEKEFIGDLYITDSYLKDGKCLNLKSGGEQPHFTEEVYKKICACNRSGKNIGKHHSEKTRKRLSEAKKGENNPNFNKEPWNKGLKYTEEQKKNIVEANKRKPTYGHLNKKHSKETKKLLSKLRKELKWFTNGQTETLAKECPEGFYPGRVKK